MRRGRRDDSETQQLHERLTMFLGLLQQELDVGGTGEQFGPNCSSLVDRLHVRGVHVDGNDLRPWYRWRMSGQGYADL